MKFIQKAKEFLLDYLYDYAFIMLIVFLLTISFFINSLFKIDTKMEWYAKYEKVINKMVLIDSRIDIFPKNKLTFVNYDDIEKNIRLFYKQLEIVNDEKFYNIYPKNRNHLRKIVTDIKTNFSKKIDILERYKSYNVSIIGSLSYIFELNRVVKNDPTIEYIDIYLIEKPMYDMLRVFINFHISKRTLDNDVKTLKELSIKYKNNDNLRSLAYNTNIVLNNIYILDKLSDKLQSFKIDRLLHHLDNIINSEHQNDIEYIKRNAYNLLILSVAVLLLFLFKYIRSIKESIELKTFRYAVGNSDNTVVITDKNRHITYVNDAFTKNTGYTKEEALGQNPRILKSGLLPEKFYKEMNTLLDAGKKWTSDFINKTKSGDIFYEKASITPMFKRGKLVGYLAIKLNVTDYIKQEKKLIYLAYHDNLTRLRNRQAMKEDIDDLLYKKRSFFILFLDLDGFKTINDTFGHDTGDELLKIISKIIKHNISAQDYAYRLGGDEFALVILEREYSLAEKIAKRVLENIAKKITIKSFQIQVTVSLGIVKYPEDGNDKKTLLKNADIAMYKAKMEGKNRYKFFNKEFSKEVEERMLLEIELKNAIKKNEFHIVYQPKYNLKTKKIYSLESLIRWRNSQLGNVRPDYFIPIAEQLGIINDIGLFVFKRACEEFKEIKKSDPDINLVSINVAAPQFTDRNLVEKFKAIVEQLKLKPSSIGIEITETCFMQNSTQTAKILKEMKEHGFEIIVDDFGTGYSSINYLKNFPIDILKIDKSFVDEIVTGKEEAKTIKAVLMVANVFDLITVAEGIETKIQEDFLINLGVDLGQGYYFSKPKPKDEIIEFIVSR